MKANLVEVCGLEIGFGAGEKPVVNGVSFEIAAGECLAIVGESGSGKSVTARALLGLSGRGAMVGAERFLIGGHDVTRFEESDWRQIRGGRIGLVAQDAMQSLDPLRKIGKEVEEGVGHTPGGSSERKRLALDALRRAGITDALTRMGQYPHELSGGLRQRTLIASAVAAGPDLLVADEPTTALDVITQQTILELFIEIKKSGTALLFISHDLAAISKVADRIAVMKDGVLVEQGTAEEILTRPCHEYTQRLLRNSIHTRRVRPRKTGDVVLSVDGVSKTYGGRVAVNDVSITTAAGETVGVVGESGAGKSTLGRLIMGLDRPSAGSIHVDGEPWSGLSERQRRRLRRRIQLIHQNPLAACDPRYSVRRIIAEAVGSGNAVAELLSLVGLPEAIERRRPDEISGGQRQRVAIARALATDPDVLVCDEAVSALDASVRGEILELLAEIQRIRSLGILFITHDLGVVHEICDRVHVMKDGVVVESGWTSEVFENPQHAYTTALLDSVPRIEFPATARVGGGDGAWP
ncbi:ATP-binding cassette domain-containing protein [Rhodococcoides yunnanense]|uniref:ATP-binding cassette domain-containing protein n=1 Tax=Rhodococcoides yunnanense TaxID=278209 RepID=UPI0011150516|nr:ABC transporter ATP-binding protein [Rhodococcus yunnanensis]